MEAEQPVLNSSPNNKEGLISPQNNKDKNASSQSPKIDNDDGTTKKSEKVMQSSKNISKHKPICQLCLLPTQIQVFQVTEDVVRHLLEIIKEVFKIRVAVKPLVEGFFICHDCNDKLFQCYDFYQKIKSGLNDLDEQNIFNEIEIKEEDDFDESVQELKTEAIELPYTVEENESNILNEDAFQYEVIEKEEFIYDPGNDVEEATIEEEFEDNEETRQNFLSDLETRVGRIIANPKISNTKKRIAFFELTCFECGAQCKDEKFLEIHQKKVHGFPRLYYFCCGKKINFKYTFSHINYHVDPEQFRCMACDYQALHYFHYTRHTRECNKTKVDCPKCQKKFSAFAIRKHIASHEPKEPTKKKRKGLPPTQIEGDIVIQNRRFGRRSRFLPGNYICDLCTHTFDSWEAIQNHMINIHLKRSQKASQYICEICGFTSTAKEYIRSHILVQHSGIEKQPCPICNRMVKKVQDHIRLNHDKSTPSVCNECGQNFANHRQLDLHWRRKHDTRKNHVCSVCGKAYKQKYQLDEHSFSHTNSYKYSCEFCSFQVNYARNLRMHRKSSHPAEYQAILQNRLKEMYGDAMAPKTVEGNKEQLAALALAKNFEIIETEVMTTE